MEQKKQVIALPDLLFLDEPTTGLDSSTALELMHAVRGYVRRPLKQL